MEVNNSANVNDIILCFSGLIENRIKFHLIKEMVWSIERKAFCLTLYLETKSLKTVQVRYRRRFNFNNFPHKFQISRLVKTFNDTGILIKSTKKGQKSTSGRKLTARSQKMSTQWEILLGWVQKKSLLGRSQELSLSLSSINRILKNDLQLPPYRIQIKQTLTQNDMAKCVDMCQWFEIKIEENPDFLFRMCGSAMKPTYLYQVMPTARALYSGDLKHQMKSFRDHCTL